MSVGAVRPRQNTAFALDQLRVIAAEKQARATQNEKSVRISVFRFGIAYRSALILTGPREARKSDRAITGSRTSVLVRGPDSPLSHRKLHLVCDGRTEPEPMGARPHDRHMPSCNWPHKNVHVREWLTELVSGNRRASWDDGVAPVDHELSIRQISKPVVIEVFAADRLAGFQQHLELPVRSRAADPWREPGAKGLPVSTRRLGVCRRDRSTVIGYLAATARGAEKPLVRRRASPQDGEQSPFPIACWHMIVWAHPADRFQRLPLGREHKYSSCAQPGESPGIGRPSEFCNADLCCGARPESSEPSSSSSALIACSYSRSCPFDPRGVLG